MIFFSVIKNLVSDEMYYYFTNNGKIIYEGFELPENANDFLITWIEGGECGHGPYLAFEGSFYKH